jgi:hypothetical protein
VRIFERSGPSDSVVYGCAYATGRRHRLGVRGGGFEDKVTLFSIAGTNVAYLSGYFGENSPHFFLFVKDVATGETRHAVDEVRTRKVVVHRSGAVAWTTTTCLWDFRTPLPGAARFADECRYVVKADAGGASVLESDLGIEPRSIRLDGRTVRWRSRGRDRSYVLHTRRG